MPRPSPEPGGIVPEGTLDVKKGSRLSARRVKIVCTLGPASASSTAIRALVRAGMDVARLNFSHGTQAEQARAMRRVREAARVERRTVAILADLAGPKIRVGDLPAGQRWRAGETVVLSSRLKPRTPGAIGTTYRGLARDLRAGQPVLLDDGRLRLEVVRVRGDEVVCKVREGGELLPHKGINLPGTPLSTPALTAKDRADLAFAVDAGVDLVALSFVRTAADVREAARLLRRAAGVGQPSAGAASRPPFSGLAPPLIAKLEKPQALDDLAGILEQSAGVMVARGDLGVEIAPEKVPMAQKRIIQAARMLGRPVITATQMLESMTERSRPTRAEASDVANAVLDGTDAVMLSAETASGRYPVEAVRMMDRIIRETELSGGASIDPRSRRFEGNGALSPQDAVSGAAVMLADTLGAAAIVAFTLSGGTALRLARRRPRAPIIAVSPDPRVLRRLSLVWGVTPLRLPRSRRLLRLVAVADAALRGHRLARAGDRVVLVMGYPLGAGARTNLVKVHVVGERT
jgi:pyruvate kinase